MIESGVTVRVKRQAMGCDWELILCGGDRGYLLDAADEAFEEVQRLEEQLSIFVPTSEVSYINALAASQPVCVEPRLFGLIESAARISGETEGAFDITAGSLVDLWRSAEAGVPPSEAIATALDSCGMHKVALDSENRTIRFSHPDTRLNLGAIGKGYAVYQVAELLRERGINNGLIHAGRSTVYALGNPPDDDAWTVGIANPTKPGERIGTAKLKDKAISTSGSHERFVEIDGVRYSHIIDPRTGWPAEGLLSVCVITDDPAESDALSTAFFVLGRDKAEKYCSNHEDISAILVSEGVEITRIGMEVFS